MYKSLEEELNCIDFEKYEENEFDEEINNAETFLKDTLHIEKADYAWAYPCVKVGEKGFEKTEEEDVFYFFELVCVAC